MTLSSGIFQTSPAILSGTDPASFTIRKAPQAVGYWHSGLLSFTVCITVLLSPFPLAGNHPILWLFWASVLGFVAVLVSLTRPSLEFSDQIKTAYFLGVFTAGFALFQAIPLPLIQGGISIELPQGTVLFPSLSIAPGATFIASLRLGSYLIFFWIALMAPRCPGQAKRVGFIIFYGIAFHAFLAVLGLKVIGDIGLIGEKHAFMEMATGPFVNRNSFATFLGMGTILGIALMGSEMGQNRKPFQHYSHLAALIIIVVTLLLTQSRMGVLTTVVAAAVLLAQGGNPIRNGVIFLAGVVGIGAIAAGFGLLDRFTDLENSVVSRLELYKQLMAMIGSRPLTGFGFDSFPLAFQLYHSPPVTADRVWDMGHSTYLTLWVEAGVLFGSLPIIAGALVTIRLWHRAKQNQPGRSMARAGLGALVLCALHSLVDFSLEIQANTFLLLALIALGLRPELNGSGRQSKDL